MLLSHEEHATVLPSASIRHDDSAWKSHGERKLDARRNTWTNIDISAYHVGERDAPLELLQLFGKHFKGWVWNKQTVVTRPTPSLNYHGVHISVFRRKGNFQTLGCGENSRSISSHSEARHSPACAQKHVCYWKHVKQEIVYFSYCRTLKTNMTTIQLYTKSTIGNTFLDSSSTWMCVVCIWSFDTSLQDSYTLHLCCVITDNHMTADSLFMDLVAGDEFQISHVSPAQLPALLSQVLKGRILAARVCKHTGGCS